MIGKTVRLGNTVHTVVGVMPEGFAFPVHHGFWVPLHADASEYERRQGPAINVFGRLAPGVSRDAAQAELTTIGLRAAAAFPKTNERLRPRLAPYASLWFGDDMVVWHLHLMQSLVTMLLVVVCVNVASLVYARTASREGEIAIRSALGGSRRRIVAQLFVEALVLSTVAAAAGLALADTRAHVRERPHGTNGRRAVLDGRRTLVRRGPLRRGTRGPWRGDRRSGARAEGDGTPAGARTSPVGWRYASATGTNVDRADRRAGRPGGRGHARRVLDGVAGDWVQDVRARIRGGRIPDGSALDG